MHSIESLTQRIELAERAANLMERLDRMPAPARQAITSLVPELTTQKAEPLDLDDIFQRLPGDPPAAPECPQTHDSPTAALPPTLRQRRRLRPMTRHPARDKAISFLLEHLKDGNPVSSRAILEAGFNAGLSEMTLMRARRILGGQLIKNGMDGGWFWQLPVTKTA